jgi:hypothetical protein
MRGMYSEVSGFELGLSTFAAGCEEKAEIRRQ